MLLRAIISTILLIASSITLLGEVAWILLLIYWGYYFTKHLKNYSLKITSIILISVILVSHFLGYKFYGSPVIVDNFEDLPEAITLKSIESPNFLIATNNKKYTIKSSLTFIQNTFTPSGPEINFSISEKFPSGFAIHEKSNYWCGNSFFPYFFPKNLPAYRLSDLGEYLEYRVVYQQSDFSGNSIKQE